MGVFTMAGHGSRYLHLREQVQAAMLLCGGDLERAGAMVGLSGRTLRNWLATKPDLVESLRSLRRQISEGAATRLTELMNQAVETLQAALKSRKAADRVRAARAILDYQRRLTSESAEERIAELEKRLDTLQRSRGMVNIIGQRVGLSIDPGAFADFVESMKPRQVIEQQPAGLPEIRGEP
jgi:hypothetical protein